MSLVAPTYCIVVIKRSGLELGSNRWLLANDAGVLIPRGSVVYSRIDYRFMTTIIYPPGPSNKCLPIWPNKYRDYYGLVLASISERGKRAFNFIADTWSWMCPIKIAGSGYEYLCRGLGVMRIYTECRLIWSQHWNVVISYCQNLCKRTKWV